MLEWLTRRNSHNKSMKTLYSFQNDYGVNWCFEPLSNAVMCKDFALPILQQLESDGLTLETQVGFVSNWDEIYAIVNHEEYKTVSALINIPELVYITPALESTGSLTDAEFGVSISGWSDFEGRAIKCDSFNGPIIKVNGQYKLIPEDSWHVIKAVNDLWQRPVDERDDINNRKHWGQIRQKAIIAKSQLSDFLYRSVVLTPDKLSIDLSRNDISNTKVVEVIPTFANCPQGWLAQFDRQSNIPNRYDIPTPEGIIQVIITPAVKTVLSQIKQMPQRRMVGVKAEAFVLNPFASLGEDASAVIDEDQFQQARIDANLTFDKFTAHINKDSMGNPIAVGLRIESANNHLQSDIKLFENDDELDNFIENTERHLKKGLQISTWRDYEFELFGNTTQELDILKDALKVRKKGFIQVSFNDVYDLSKYSERIEEIGNLKPFYSPYIPKKDTGDSWFPEDLIPIIVWTDPESEEPIAVPITPELEDLIREKLQLAEQSNDTEIVVPSFPKPIPLVEAKNILASFDAFRKDPDSKPTEEGGEALRKNVSHETLIIKANIQNVDYQELSRELLTTYSDNPVMPSALKNSIELLPHQLQGVAWLQHLFNSSPKNCRGCILADDMGLGKTLQLLTMIAWAFEKDSDLSPALIVAPVSLLENWQEEIQKFFNKGSLPFAIVYGDNLRALRLPRTSIDSQLIEKGLVKFLKPNWIGSAKIVLTTYETLRDLEFSFASEHWSIMVCDEAQKIKNPSTLVTTAAKKQNVRFRIACTGTPVENSLTDLWCLFDFIQPGLLGGLNEFGSQYRKPIEAKTETEKAKVAELREKIKPQLLRRTKAEVTDLKPKIIVKECQQLPISKFQLSIYSQAVTLFNNRHEPDVRSPFKNHLGLLQYLRAICTDPRHIGTETSTQDSITSYSTKAPKLDWLIKELKRIQGLQEKVIVFCEFRGVQRLLRHYIQESFGFTPDVINGDTETSSNHQNSRHKKIKAFQEQSGFGIIILSPIAVGFGVNIQAANHVIHYTRTWNPAKEDQATDRAYRIGQKKEVYVYYPVVTSDDFTTFDVKLHELLEYKRELASDMLNGTGEISAVDFDITRIVPQVNKRTINPVIGFEYLLTISPKYLEGLTAALWQAQGYSTVYRTPDSGDDGVDVVALNADKGVLIQCKSSMSENKLITWDAIKDVVTGKASYELRHPGINFELICLTNQRFNPKAIEQASLNNVSIIQQNDLKNLLEKYNNITFIDVENFIFK